MSYSVKLYFNLDELDITEYIVSSSFKKEESLYKSLKPNTNTISFMMMPNVNVFNALISFNGDVKCIVLKDGVPYFTGFVSPTYEQKILAGKGLVPYSLQIEDIGIRTLQRVIKDSFIYIGYKVSNPSLTTSSIIHKLLTLANVTSYTLPLIDITIPFYSYLYDEKKTYWQLLESILFEAGYTFYFDDAGVFKVFKWSECSLTGVATWDSTNILKDSLSIKKTREEYSKVNVEWTSLEYKTDIVVFEDTTGGNDTNRCNINVLPLAAYPESSDIKTVFSDYKSDEYTIKGVVSSTLNVVQTGLTLFKSVINYGSKALFSYKNNSSTTTGVITKLQIKGNAYIEKATNTSIKEIETISGRDAKELDYSASYLYDDVNILNFINGITNYYKYSDSKITFKAVNDVALGTILKITDSTFTNSEIYVRVIGKVYSTDSTSIIYSAEGIGEYTFSAIDEEFSISKPVTSFNPIITSNLTDVQNIVDLGLNTDGSVKQIINSNTFVDTEPSGDGLYLTKSYIGMKKTGVWTSYIANNGTFQFKGDANNYVNWNGTKLSVKGEMYLSGNSTITGKISTGSLQSNTYVAGTSGFNLNSDGSAEFNNITVRGPVYASSGTFTGTITSTAGTIGGFTLGATSLVAGSGVTRISLNTADGIHLGNDTFASAPFRVSRDGVLTASGATISGAITATSGSFTGSLTSTSGTIGGFTLAATTLTGGSLSLTNTGNITAGTVNDIIRVSADDATYRLWIGNATAASAPFRITKAGVLTATGATISGAITATSGSFTGSLTSTSGTIGGFTLGSTSLIAGSGVTRVSVATTGIHLGHDTFASAPFRVTPDGALSASSGSVGGFTLGATSLIAGSGVTRISLNTADGIHLGNDTFASAPFRVTRAGVLTATGATISGTLTASAGTIGGFTLGTTSLIAGSGVTRVSVATTGIHLGNDTFGSAPFRVTPAGVLTATGATISGTLTATAGTIGGFTLGSTSLIAGSGVTRISLNTADGIHLGNDTFASAPFRVTRAGVLTATGATISGAITATSGSFTGTVTASGGAIGGMTITSTELKSSNYVSNTSGFLINNTGFAEFNNINVRGDVNSTSGSIGGWLITTDKLVSNATGSRIALDKTLSRVSIHDTSGVEKVAMGYLSGLAKNVGSGTYTSSDYGFWVKPGDTIQVDGPMKILNGDMTASDSSFKVFSGATETLRMGIDTAVSGLHLYHANGKVSLSNSASDSMRIQSDGGYIDIGAMNTTWAHFNTDRPAFYFYKNTTINGTLNATTITGTSINGTSFRTTTTTTDWSQIVRVGSGAALYVNQTLTTVPIAVFSSGSATPNDQNKFIFNGDGTMSATSSITATEFVGKIKATTGTGADSDTVYIKDANLQLKERTIQNGVWTYNYNQNLLTTSDVVFAKTKVTTGTGTDSNTVYIKDSLGYLKERAIQDGVWTYNYNQSLLTTASPTFNNVTAGSYIPASGVLRSNLGSPTVGEIALTPNQATDKLKFYPIANLNFEKTTDGTTWISMGVTDNDKKLLVTGNNTSGIAIPRDAIKARLTVTCNSYVYLNWLYLYTSTNGNSMYLTIEKSFDGTTWDNVVANSGNASSWPGHFFLPHANISFNPSPTLNIHWKYVRITFTPTWSHATNVISLLGLQWLGGYPSANRELYTWDYDRNVSFPAVVNGTEFVGKIKATTGTGADSDTVYIKDANLQLKERTIPAVAWTNTQAVNTTSDVVFAKTKVTTGTGTDSNTVYTKDSLGYLKERAIPAVAWTNTQAVNTTNSPTFKNITLGGTGVTIEQPIYINLPNVTSGTAITLNSFSTVKATTGYSFIDIDSGGARVANSITKGVDAYIQDSGGSYNYAIYAGAIGATNNYSFYGHSGTMYNNGRLFITSSGTGADSDSIYIRDSDGYFKLRSIPSVAWTNTQAVTATSDVLFNSIISKSYIRGQGLSIKTASQYAGIELNPNEVNSPLTFWRNGTAGKTITIADDASAGILLTPYTVPGDPNSGLTNATLGILLHEKECKITTAVGGSGGTSASLVVEGTITATSFLGSATSLANLIPNTTTTYGAYYLNSTRGSYYGIALAGAAKTTFMSNGTDNGIYNEAHSKWLIINSNSTNASSSYNFGAPTVTGAVGNDFADRLDIEHDNTEAGYVVSYVNGKTQRTNKRNDKKVLGLITDTASVIAGDGDNKGQNIAVAGYVLAFTDRDYICGTKLTVDNNGKLTKARFYEKVIAIYLDEVKTEKWNGVDVHGRRLVKVVN